MKKQDAGRKAFEGFADEFARLNDDVLFGEEWAREDKLSLRDRSIITVTALMTKGITDNSIEYHILNARNNGVTKTEMVEIVTHLAFYVGWPNAWAVMPIVKEVYQDASDDSGAYDPVFGLGEYNKAYEQYFSGKSYLNPLSNLHSINNVTFEPGCRNNWHIHHAAKGGGQILLCVAGRGWYQEWGKEAIELHPGDRVDIPAEVKHWHGAAKDSWFSHIAIEVPGENTGNEWLEPVDDEHYENLK